MNVFSEKKIAVIGIGGVGGYLATLLSKTYPNVSIVARGERKKAIETNGLILHSDYRGEHQAFPYCVVSSASELSVQDYLFICVKNYSLDAILPTLSSCVDKHTIVVPVMNGVDPGDRTRAALKKGIVIDSLIYIVSFSNPDFSITQQDSYANIHVGIQNPTPNQKQNVEKLAALLNQAQIDCEAHSDIKAEIWKKYMLNCAYNVATAFYNLPFGALRSNPSINAELTALVMEAFSVAKANHIHVSQSDVDHILYRFQHLISDHATSSLQRDVAQKKQSELEVFSGFIVREAERLGIDVPVSRFMYEGLKKSVYSDSAQNP